MANHVTATTSAGDQNAATIDLMDVKWKKYARDFLINYNTNIGLKFVVRGNADFYYIPEVLKDEYIMAADIFRSNGCFVELAVPAISFGLSLRENNIYVNGSSLWGGDRTNPWHAYKEDHVFMHPFKTMKDLESAEGRQFFCDTFLKRYGDFIKQG